MGQDQYAPFPRFYVKRCIGIPGDSLQIQRGILEINGRRGIGNLNDQEMLSNYRGEYPAGNIQHLSIRLPARLELYKFRSPLSAP